MPEDNAEERMARLSGDKDMLEIFAFNAQIEETANASSRSFSFSMPPV